MPLNIPENAQAVENRTKVDVQNQIPTANPFLPNSWLGSFISAISNRIFDFYQNLNEGMLQSFWDTSTGNFLKRQASWFDVSKLSATQSKGNLVITGTATTNIPSGTEFKTENDVAFTTDISTTVTNAAVTVNVLSKVGNLVFATTNVPHNYTSGVVATISGANESEFNGSFEVTVTSDLQFFYEKVVTNSVATGTIISTADSISAAITSVEFSSEANFEGNTKLTISSPIAGIDNENGLEITGVVGGTDIESDEDFRLRFLNKTKFPTANFNDTQIKQLALEIDGVTRVFVRSATPVLGQITVFFVRDNDPDIVPSPGEITEVKNAILTIKPAAISDSSVIVSGPTAANAQAFTFLSIVPDTAAMRTSIETNLQLYFSTSIGVGDNLLEDDYRSAINGTIDSATGDRLESFELPVPAGLIASAADEIFTLGTVTFP